MAGLTTSSVSCLLLKLGPDLCLRAGIGSDHLFEVEGHGVCPPDSPARASRCQHTWIDAETPEYFTHFFLSPQAGCLRHHEKSITVVRSQCSFHLMLSGDRACICIFSHICFTCLLCYGCRFGCCPFSRLSVRSKMIRLSSDVGVLAN